MKYSLILLFILSLLLPGCGSLFKTTITVSAASPFKEYFTEVKERYEAENSGIAISYQFDDSQALAKDTDADVFASADTVSMQKARDAGLARASQIFARNRLVVIVPINNVAQVYTLKDLADQGVKIHVMDPSTPLGQSSQQALDNLSKSADYGPSYTSSVQANIVSLEQDVRTLVQKVQSGKADAGIVYQTDITTDVAQNVVAIDIPTDSNIFAQYPIAVTEGTAHADEAQAFVRYVLSPAGQAILKKHRFTPAR